MRQTAVRHSLALVLGLLATAMSATLSADPTPARASGRWAVDQTRALVGESRMLVFVFDAPQPVDAEYAVTVEPAGAVTVLHPLRVLAGNRHGFARIRPAREGDASVHLEALAVATCAIAVSEPAATHELPRLITPTAGAVVWGEFSAAAFVPGTRPTTVTLRAFVAGAIASADEIVAVEGGHEAIFHTVDAGDLAAGDCIVYVDAAHGEQTTTSAPTRIRVADASATARYGTAIELALAEMPDEDWEQPEWVAEAPSAPSGTFVVHAEPWPMTHMPVDGGETGGWFQMAVVARGDPAGGIWPEIAVTLDNRDYQWQTRGTLVREGWHRVIVGRPVWVPAGEHWLSPFFLNDFWVERAFDRNLYLDSVEIMAVASAPSLGETIAFATPIDGVHVHGSFDVQAVIARDGRAFALPPDSVLAINQRDVARQRSDRPRFRVGTADLDRGANRIDVYTTRDGAPTARATATVYWDGEGNGQTDGLVRLTASEDGWTGGVPVIFDEENPDGRSLAFVENQTASIALPTSLDGRFEVTLFMRGEWWADAAAELRVLLDGEEIEGLEAEGWWDRHEVGTIRLDGQPHTLSVEFLNPSAPGERGEDDEFEEEDDEEDDDESERQRWWLYRRSLMLSAVELRDVGGRDRRAPDVKWVYPAEGATIGLDDAMIVDVTDASGIANVRVFVDGEPLLGSFVSLEDAIDARVCIPIALRLEPGVHTIAVEAADRHWREGVSEERRVHVTDNADTTFARAVHLLNRLGYGPEPRLLRELLTATDWQATLRSWLTAGPDARAEAIAVWRFGGLGWEEAALRAMDIGLYTDNPVRYRLVTFLENHFSTWLEKTGGYAEWDDWQRFNRVGAGRFRDALFASATSPAMLMYLDNAQSFAHTLNENYARELLELHTLGVDNGYTQADVTALAHILTGWSTANEAEAEWPTRFAFHHRVHDRQERDVIGYRFGALTPRASATQCRDRGVRALELLAAHPNTAEHIARKLIENYLADPAPPALQARLAQRFLETDGDLAELLLALEASDEFRNAIATPRGNDPFAYGMRATRCGNAPEVWYLFEFLEQAQRLPMHHAAPNGYPVTPDAWLDSAGMHARFAFAAHVSETMMWRLFQGPERWDVERFDARWNQALIDHIALRLTGKRLNAKQNHIALEMLADVDDDMDASERVGLAITFVLQLPAANTQ